MSWHVFLTNATAADIKKLQPPEDIAKRELGQFTAARTMAIKAATLVPLPRGGRYAVAPNGHVPDPKAKADPTQQPATLTVSVVVDGSAG